MPLADVMDIFLASTAALSDSKCLVASSPVKDINNLAMEAQSRAKRRCSPKASQYLRGGYTPKVPEFTT